MRNLAPLSEGVPAADRSLFVRAVDPGLVEALEDPLKRVPKPEGSVQRSTAD